MTDQKITTAEEAMDFIEVQRAIGLTPVMAGTSFYRHGFTVSQFNSYIEYLDERGTVGRCQPKNLLRTFDFISLGRPVPGSLPDFRVAPAPAERGFGVVTAVIPGRRQPSLLEAATAALRVMAAGPERDDLAEAVAQERRIH